MKKTPVLYYKKIDCCGCMACYNICPVSAIIMQEDEEGFLYPKIDGQKCLCCNKCEKVCPIKFKDGGKES